MKNEKEVTLESEKNILNVKVGRKKMLPYMKYKQNMRGLTKELIHKPDILQFILYLQRLLIFRKKKIEKLSLDLNNIKMENKPSLSTISTQTDDISNDNNVPKSDTWNNENKNTASIADQVKEAAENALQQTGMVYETTSGMYYDYNTGYYYNPETGLYYHSSTGCYYYYDKEQNTFSFHSQADICDFSTEADDRTTRKEKQKEKKRKRKSDDSKNKDDKNTDDSIPKKKKNTLTSNESDGNNDNNDITENTDDTSLIKDDKKDVDCSENSKTENNDDNKIIDASSDEEGLLPTSEEDSESSESDESISSKYPPCMRIIVNETEAEKIKVGSLFILTKEGGTIGREGNHSIIIPEGNISRHHLTFKYDEEERSYFVKDMGSRNGTLLNGKILMPTKEESEFLQVVHGSMIQIGNTKLLCHVHKGNDTCGHCEPGLLIKETKAAPQKYCKPLNMKTLHKQELRRLKQKYKVAPTKSEGASGLLPEGYEDKAQLRREKVGSTHHAVKTEQACLETNIVSTNKGYKMLEKMGWSAGDGLGKLTHGIKEPVALVGNVGTSGLGSGGLAAPSCSGSAPSTSSAASWKQELWRTTQKRFDKAATSAIFSVTESDEEDAQEQAK